MNIKYYDNENLTGNVLLYLRGSSCALCDAMYEKTIDELEGSTITMYVADIKDHPALRGQFLVFSNPTLLCLKEGKEIHRESGYFDFDRLKKVVNNL